MYIDEEVMGACYISPYPHTSSGRNPQREVKDFEICFSDDRAFDEDGMEYGGKASPCLRFHN